MRAALVMAAGMLAAGCAARGTDAGGARDGAAPAESAPPLPMPPPPNPKPGRAVAESHPSKTARTAGWIVLGIGAESAIVAGATSVVILNDLSSRSNGCNAQRVCTPGGFGANAQIDSLSGWNAGSWILAAAGLGVGSWLVLANRPDQKPAAEVSLTPVGTGAAITVRGAF